MEGINKWIEKMEDKDELVRLTVAERIDSKYLPQMMRDENEKVRQAVAEKID